jgi:predicted DNA-binding transcriptional regulator AlpA
VTTKNNIPNIPPALADVALIDATTCAAAGAMSLSWWHEEVRAQRAPQPAVRMSRCTRWRMSDVAAFWQAFAAQDQHNSAAAEQVKAKAKQASIKAREPAAVAKAQATRQARIAARQGVAA